MRLPNGWAYVSDYCIRSGDYTVCRIGNASGCSYELWRLTEQLAVNLPSAQVAIDEHDRYKALLEVQNAQIALGV